MSKANVDLENEDQLADIEAAMDSAIENDEELEDINKRIPFVVKFSTKYQFDGSEISEIDLSGLEDLTTQDAQFLDKVMVKMQHRPNDKFRDTIYTKHIAMKVTGLPVEFFNMLRMKDMQNITSRIAIYFLA